MLLMCKNTPIYDIDNEKILKYKSVARTYEAKRCKQSYFYKVDEVPLFIRHKHDGTQIKGNHIRTGSAYAH